MKYYYLVASLPAIALGVAPVLDRAGFRVLCGEHLSESHLRELEALWARQPAVAGSTFARRFLAAEDQLRTAVARWRAARAARTVEVRPTAQVDLWLEAAAREALGQGDPLQRELWLDRLRWRILEDLARHDPFGLSAVLSYGLRLSLCERWAAMDADAGRERLHGALAALARQA